MAMKGSGVEQDALSLSRGFDLLSLVSYRRQVRSIDVVCTKFGHDFIDMEANVRKNDALS